MTNAQFGTNLHAWTEKPDRSRLPTSRNIPAPYIWVTIRHPDQASLAVQTHAARRRARTTTPASANAVGQIRGRHGGRPTSMTTAKLRTTMAMMTDPSDIAGGVAGQLTVPLSALSACVRREGGSSRGPSRLATSQAAAPLVAGGLAA